MMFCSQRRSCAMLAAKKKLPAKAAAAGLQLIIQGAQRIGTLTAIMTRMPNSYTAFQGNP